MAARSGSYLPAVRACHTATQVFWEKSSASSERPPVRSMKRRKRPPPRRWWRAAKAFSSPRAERRARCWSGRSRRGASGSCLIWEWASSGIGMASGVMAGARESPKRPRGCWPWSVMRSGAGEKPRSLSTPRGGGGWGRLVGDNPFALQEFAGDGVLELHAYDRARGLAGPALDGLLQLDGGCVVRAGEAGAVGIADLGGGEDERGDSLGVIVLALADVGGQDEGVDGDGADGLDKAAAPVPGLEPDGDLGGGLGGVGGLEAREGADLNLVDARQGFEGVGRERAGPGGLGELDFELGDLTLEGPLGFLVVGDFLAQAVVLGFDGADSAEAAGGEEGEG